MKWVQNKGFEEPFWILDTLLLADSCIHYTLLLKCAATEVKAVMKLKLFR